MQRNVKMLKGYRIHIQGEEAGQVSEFFFDDRNWTVRYLVVDTWNWEKDEQVLISPQSIWMIDHNAKTIELTLSKNQYKESPVVRQNPPVSRQAMNEGYSQGGWLSHWQRPSLWGSLPDFFVEEESGYSDPSLHPEQYADSTQYSHMAAARDDAAVHLRSTHDVCDCKLHARAGVVGRVIDYILDTDNWKINYLVMKVKGPLNGKRRLLSPATIEYMNEREGVIYTNLSRDQICYTDHNDGMEGKTVI